MDPKMMMQVPNAVRELAEKSVEQAEKAFEAFMSAASKSVAMVPSPATDMSKNTMTLADKNMKAAFDHARKLIHAKDVQEVMQLQADFLKSQFAAAGERMKELSTRGVSAAKGHIEKQDMNSLSMERAQRRKCVLVLPTKAA